MEYWENRLIRQTCFTENDKKLFMEYATQACAEGNKPIRIEKYRTDMTISNTITGMGSVEMIRDEPNFTLAISRINSSKVYAFTTKKNIKNTLGSFFCFHHYKDRSITSAPRSIRKLIQHRAKGEDRRIAKPIITREEMHEMLKFGDTFEQSFISLLFDSGMRIGEILQLRKNNLSFVTCPAEKDGMAFETADIKVPAGKTGERNITCAEPLLYIKRWLAVHPMQNDDNAPLWVSPTAHKQVGKRALEMRLKRIVRRMNEQRKQKDRSPFNKPYNFHQFRHSRATEMAATGMVNEAIMCKFFGWEIGSAMPRTYLHLTDEQVKTAVMRTYGYIKKEAPIIQVNRECPICHKLSPIGETFCGGCGYDIDANAAASKVPIRTIALETKLEILQRQLGALQLRLHGEKKQGCA